MTLRSSFLTDMLENRKRRNWVFWFNFLIFFSYFPGYLVLNLNNIRSRYQQGNGYDLVRMKERISEIVENVFWINGFMPVIVIAMAILIGMQGFVYLHNKRQVDFYHSQPVSRKRRFAVLWVNGILIFVVSYLINLILGMAVAAVYGAMSSSIFWGAIKGFFLYFLLFLGIYHLAILAIELTGNTLVSLLAMGVLLGYELAIRAMTIVMSSGFFLTFGYGEEEKILDTLFSPIVILYKYIYLREGRDVYTQYASGKYTYGTTVTGLLLLAVLFGLLSFFLYGRRASESHGNSISFPRIKEGLRFALLLPAGCSGTCLFYYIAGESVVLGIIGAVFCVILGHAVLQLIYEVDFRAIGQKWVTALISLAAVILVFLGFRYDWLGYDYRIPKQSKVDSVYLSMIAEGYGDDPYIMMDGTEIYGQSYARNNMELKDLDTVYALLENREKIKMTSKEYDGKAYEHIEVTFRMKNGTKKSRRLFLHYEDNFELLNKIYHMQEYKEANHQVWEENFVDTYKIIGANYHNGLRETTLASMDWKELVDAYCKDYEKGKYAEVYYDVPIGKVTLLGIGFRDQDFRNRWDLIIYDSYTNTKAVLSKAGISYENVFDEGYLNKIQKIEIRYEDYEKMEYVGTRDECYKTAIYTNQDTYTSILENAVPSGNFWWNSQRGYRQGEYCVYVYTPNPYDAKDYYLDEVFFQSGEIPKFIIEDIEKIPYGEERIIQ